MQVESSLQLAKNFALHQVAHENDARGVKSLKIQAFFWCSDGTIVDGALKHPNCKGCNVIETITVVNFSKFKALCKLERNVALNQVAYENKARGLKN